MEISRNTRESKIQCLATHLILYELHKVHLSPANSIFKHCLPSIHIKYGKHTLYSGACNWPKVHTPPVVRPRVPPSLLNLTYIGYEDPQSQLWNLKNKKNKHYPGEAQPYLAKRHHHMFWTEGQANRWVWQWFTWRWPWPVSIMSQLLVTSNLQTSFAFCSLR